MVISSLLPTKNSSLPSTPINSMISPIERKLMEKTRAFSNRYGVETARVIEKNGKIPFLQLFEYPNSVNHFSRKGIKLFDFLNLGIIGQIIKTAQINKNGTHIHSHLVNMPFSGGDLIFMVKNKFKRMVVTTPDGGDYLLERIKRFINIKEVLKAADEIKKAHFQKFKELNISFNVKDGFVNVTKENLKKFNSFAIDLWQNFAKNKFFGFKFVKL